MPPRFSQEESPIFILNASHAGQHRTSPCEMRCPLGNGIQKMEKAIADNQPDLALRILRARNPFPGITGRICPHPCEEACNRQQYDEPLSIRALERYAADHGEFQEIRPLPASGKKIAIVGSGPAGMSCAYYAALLGHEVTVFESSPVAGGVPRQSIPDFRLPKGVVEKELGFILRLGVHVLTNAQIGRDIALSALQERYDACLLAVGNTRERMLSIPGGDSMCSASAFLKDSNLNRNLMPGRKVVVFGGGGVAFDCAFTAKRLGAEEVHIVCLESREAMRAPAAEVRQALDEGIAIHNNYLARAVITENGVVSAAAADAVLSFSFDDKGELHAEFLAEDSKVVQDEFHTEILKKELLIPADMVICASGLMANLDFLGSLPLQKTARGFAAADADTCATSIPGIFAAGECASGPSLVAPAIAQGRKAAFGIDAFLTGRDGKKALDVWIEENTLAMAEALPSSPHEVAFSEIVNIGYHPKKNRQQTTQLQAKETWFAFEELDKGLSDNAAAEAERCLHCGHCQNCGECVASCPGLILTKEDRPKVAYPDECWHCGCCRLACPGACIDFHFPLHTML